MPVYLNGKNDECDTSRSIFITSQDLSQTHTNKTDGNNTEFNKTQSINLSFDEMTDGDDLETLIFREMITTKSLPKTYIDDTKKLNTALHILSEHETFVLNAEVNFDCNRDLSILNLFIEALFQMLTTSKEMHIKGQIVHKENVYDKLVNCITFDGCFPCMYELYTTAMDDFKTGAMNSEIKNHLGYMKSCIWNVLVVGDIGLQVNLLNHFG